MAIKIKVGGSYVDPAAIKVKVNGSYQDPAIYTKVNGLYQSVSVLKSVRPVTSQYRFYRDTYRSASYDSFAHRLAVYITDDTDYIQLSWYLWYMTVNKPQIGVMTSVTVKNIAIDTGTQAASVTFDSGSVSKVINGGNSDVRADKLYATSVGLTKFLRGTTVFIKYTLKVATANVDYVPFSTYRSKRANEQVLRYMEANTTVSAANITGAFTTTGAAPDTAGTAPYMEPVVLGEHGNNVGCIVGDSLANGANDSTTAYLPFDYGYLSRALRQSDNSMVRPSINFGMGSSFINYIYSSTDGQLAEPYIAMCQFIEWMTGTNDIIAGQLNLATLQGRYNAGYAFFNGLGITKIIQSGLMCKTTSTDSWATLVNQTPTTGFTSGGAYQQVNAWLQTLPGTSITAYYDPAPVRDSGDPTRFAVTGAANYMTTDGTHPQPIGHTLMAPELRAIVDSNVSYI